MKAVLLDWSTMGPDLDISALRSLLPGLEIHDETPDDLIAERVRDAEIVLGNKVMLSADLFRRSPRLRLIALTATGTDNVDTAAAEQHGIAVCNIRAYCTRSVVEHVFGCLLNLTHNLAVYSADTRAGAWQRATDFCLITHPIRELSGMTLGIVGYGELGRGVARAAEAFGMDVIVAARPGATSIAPGRVGFDELLRRADVISLHCPLTDATHNLFGPDEFRRMKRSALLINTARGKLVDSAALADALRHGEIAGAAIDVLPTEPPVDGDPLLDYEGDNLMVTPHIAWGTLAARQNAIDELTANVAAFLEGRERNRIV